MIGFRSRDVALQFEYNLKHAAFLYPNDALIEGSSSVVSALLKYLTSANKVAICRMKARAIGIPRVVALLPQLETIDSDGYQVIPPGFHVVTLPYVDDIRDLQKSSTSMTGKPSYLCVFLSQLPEHAPKNTCPPLFASCLCLLFAMTDSRIRVPLFAYYGVEYLALQNYYRILEDLALEDEAADDNAQLEQHRE